MTRQQDDGDTLSLSDLMLRAAENISNARWTMMPVRVVLYDPVRQCVDAQPVVSVIGDDGLPHLIPPIFCSPIAYPAWGGYRVQAPVLPGDLGVLLISSASMASWMITGTDGILEESPRRQSLSDAVYLGGMHALLGAPGAGGPPTPSTGLRAGGTAAWVEITDPALVLAEATSIQLGLTAIDPLTKWPALSTMLGQIVADIAALAASIGTCAFAATAQANVGAPAPPTIAPVPTFTTVDPTTATIKVIGE